MKKKNPLYKTIALDLKRAIERGEYRCGDKLPVESELCDRFCVSRITVRQAIKLLSDCGYVKRKQGSGTYVTVEAQLICPMERSASIIPFSEEMKEAGIAPSVDVVSLELVQMPKEVAHDLSLPAGARAYQYERVLKGDNEPLSFERGYMPITYFPDFSVDKLSGSKTHYIESIKNRIISYTRVSVSAVPADEVLASRLNVAQGSPLVRQAQIVYDSTGTAIEKTISYFNSDRYSATYIKKK